MNLSARFTGLWQHPDFVKLWVGETISLFGSQITALALPLTAETILKATPQQMGNLSALQFLPFLLFGLFAGVWVDRTRRRPIMMVADIGRGILLMTIPLATIAGALGMDQLYFVGFLVGVLTLFFDVSYQAYLPSLVSRENLTEGNSKLEISRATSAVAGPALAGVLIKLMTAPITILLDGISFLVSAFFLGRITVIESAPTPHAERRNMIYEVGEGLKVVFGNRMLRSIAACTATSNLFGSIQFAVVILFLRRELGLDEGLIGLVFSLGSIGALLGAVLITPVTKRIGVGGAIWGMTLLYSIAACIPPLVLRGDIAGLAMLGVSQFFVSVSGVIYNVNQVSLRQTITPDRLQGRMNATMRFLVWGTIPIGSWIGGQLGATIGLRETMWVGGIGSLLAVLWVFFSPVRTLREMPKPVAEASAVTP